MFEVGKKYIMPCIQWQKRIKVWVPILGGRHPDPELGNPRPHYHIDVRFISPQLLTILYDGKPYSPQTIRVMSSPVDLPVVHRPVRCYRVPQLINPKGIYDFEINGIPLEDFETSMCNAKVIERDGCKSCPHKGMPLYGALEIIPGVVECPGHGLAWDITTGRLYRRTARFTPDQIEKMTSQ